MMSLSFMCQREEGIDKCRVACRQGVVVYLFICLFVYWRLENSYSCASLSDDAARNLYVPV